jgi:hypothetical protein
VNAYNIPSLADFLSKDTDDIVPFAPATMVYAAGGTRRAAILAGIPPTSEQYPRWTLQQMVMSFQLLFDHGVRHVITLAAGPGQFEEIGPYRDHLLEWIEWGVAGEQAMEEYLERGWRVRLISDGKIPDLEKIANRLTASAGSDSKHSVWFVVASNSESAWDWLIDKINRTPFRDRQDLIRLIYGEDIPLISLFLSFGKPIVTPDLLPPLLVGKVQCYWTQRPGYSLTQQELRQIVYDYAFLRPTWRADKTSRTYAARESAEVWDESMILGLGSRLGPYWYPGDVQR